MSQSKLTYDFRRPRDCHLSNNNSGFIIPLILLESGFHLPLHPFFYVVLNKYDRIGGTICLILVDVGGFIDIVVQSVTPTSAHVRAISP